MDWDAIVDDLGPRLYRYFRASFTVPAAEDLVQVTLLRLIEKIEAGRFDPSLGNLAMYAFGIAHYSALEYRRKNDGPVDQDLEIADAKATERLDDAVATRRLRRAIARLEEPQRRVVTLLIDEDLTLGEIATILDLPVNTVKSHVHRAKHALAQMMGESE